ncbi:neuroblastoma breakpoint family member 9-like [Diceros bicornis minor]|uniref:neuroblastoma breakpoint family member 9-like n=1 Tax=Diceros bicornis minor TaxID=77932 RepID=UPI0026EB5430|nr:neuroblastoma breakpoint family member 9-like [Diceros bicornis minor]
MTVHEINQELHSQLAKSEQDFQDLMEKFLVSQATTYSLAKELQKYKCGEYQDLVESVLGEKLHLEEGKLAEQWALAEKLREYNIRIRDQEQQLTHLRHQVQEGREVSVLLHQHLSDLLTHDDPDDDQGPGFGEQLAEGCGLAKRLAGVLSSECGEYQDLVESVLGEKLHLEEGKLAEQWALAEKLREYNIRIRDQEQQLTHLRHQVQEGREVSVLLHQHLSDLLTHDDPDDDQGPGFGEQLAEGCGLAKRLAGVLSSAAQTHIEVNQFKDWV